MSRKCFSRSADFPTFRIERPVDIDGPFPYNFCASPGDVTLVQIRFVAGAATQVSHICYDFENNGFARPVDVAIDYRRAAFLNATPQTSPTIGVGYVEVFVKSIRAEGVTNIVVQIEMSDGSIKNVPINMFVTATRESAASQWDEAAGASE
jgi:hypothetical protein